MSIDRPRIGLFARIAAGALGSLILGAGLIGTWLTLRGGAYLWAPLPFFVGIGGSAVFLQSAYVGSSPRWDEYGD